MSPLLPTSLLLCPATKHWNDVVQKGKLSTTLVKTSTRGMNMKQEVDGKNSLCLENNTEMCHFTLAGKKTVFETNN